LENDIISINNGMDAIFYEVKAVGNHRSRNHGHCEESSSSDNHSNVSDKGKEELSEFNATLKGTKSAAKPGVFITNIGDEGKGV
jgi:hypothetical protein